jgi:non-ribosomal peptide synthase protein (TIGR01720 family)
MDLVRGPVFRAALFECGASGQRLLLAAHHLVIDAVSWHILLADLEEAYNDPAWGLSEAAPEQTTSFRRWAEYLAEEAAQLAFDREGQTDSREDDCSTVPTDHCLAANDAASERREAIRLSNAETARVLALADASAGNRLHEILLAAAASALAEWTGRDEIVLEVEDHGRSDLPPGIDLTRTSGWFTATLPVRLCIGADLLSTLLAARRELLDVGLRARRHSLREYAKRAPAWRNSKPEIAFNFLGNFDASLGAASMFRLASEDPGPSRSGDALRPHVLEISGGVLDRHLHLAISYSSHLHNRGTIEKLLESYRREVLSMAETMENSGLPADISLPLGEDEWAHIVANASSQTV